MKKYKENGKKNNALVSAIEELILIFVVATVSIILYDIYINVDVTPSQEYSAVKIAQETNIETKTDISDILENTSKSVVRDIKNYNKRYRHIQL